MQLSKRPPVYALPSYSLTGDLLGFLRCGLQYRYSRIGQLPPTRPVQLWFGQFVHGVLEEAFRRFDQARREGSNKPPPWPQSEIDDICDLISQRLASQGLIPWDPRLEHLGRARAEAAINDLGPELFPIIHRAEVRLTGARSLPIDRVPPEHRFRDVDRYEIVGVIDVISHVELSDPAHQNNLVVKAILAELPSDPPDQFEIIIDYKGMRRPTPIDTDGNPDPYWQIYDWQLQTYAHLRAMHADSLPVVAGILLYTNELLPTWEDLKSLKQEVTAGVADVEPVAGSEAEKALSDMKRSKAPIDPATGRRAYPQKLPLEFRLARAMRVTSVSTESIEAALVQFDSTVVDIETCRGKEYCKGSVLGAWENYSVEEDTCAVCDYRTYCPGYCANFKGGRPQVPELPGRK
jgi:PD-(D/E)XK nuclease superfamily protein